MSSGQPCVAIGQSPNTPQTTEQKKWQFRNDFSWHVTGMGGVGHDFKAGVNFINEPRLFITFNSGKGVIQHTHLTDVVGGPISVITLNDGDASGVGGWTSTGGSSSSATR